MTHVLYIAAVAVKVSVDQKKIEVLWQVVFFDRMIIQLPCRKVMNKLSPMP